jgi:hypothetical protein
VHSLIRILRKNLVLVAVLVLGLSAGAYAAKRIGSDDLKGMRFVEASKTIKPDQRKNVKANCRKGELLINSGYGISPDIREDPTPQANVVSLLAVRRQSKGKFPDQVILDVANPGNGGLPFEADAFAWCLKQ